MAASVYAMEAMTYQTAALIDAAAEDYMLETAMLKVMATEHLWKIINDTIQIYGGKAYSPMNHFERMLRDARIKHDRRRSQRCAACLRAMVVCAMWLELQGILNSLWHPLKNWNRLTSFAGKRLESYFPQSRSVSSSC